MAERRGDGDPSRPIGRDVARPDVELEPNERRIEQSVAGRINDRIDTVEEIALRYHRGPLPSADEFQGYEDAVPGAGKPHPPHG